MFILTISFVNIGALNNINYTNGEFDMAGLSCSQLLEMVATQGTEWGAHDTLSTEMMDAPVRSFTELLTGQDYFEVRNKKLTPDYHVCEEKYPFISIGSFYNVCRTA